MTSTASAIRTLIEDAAGRHPGRPAILAPGREPLTYRDLVDLVEDTGRQLRALGLGRDATVAAVFPNGPDMATAFVALSASCACAPLNPAFTRPDFERCLHGLGARALLVDVPHLRFVEEGTIEALAADVDAAGTGNSPLGALQPYGRRLPLYCIPGHDGILIGLARLARALPADQPVWAFDLRRLGRSATIEGLAARCLDLLLAHDAEGPYHLAGVCFGGVVVAALAHHLEAHGRRVESLALIDSLNPAWSRTLSRSTVAVARLAQLREKARYHSDRIRAMDTTSRFHYVSDRAAAFLRNHGESAGALLGLTSPRAQDRRLAFRHTPKAVAASAIVIRIRGRRPHAPGLGWADTFRGGVTTIDVPFAPHGALAAGTVGRVAAILCDAPRDGT